MADVSESQDVESGAERDADGTQPLDALLQAVKIAAAGAAVGAAAAAARALSHRDDEQVDEEENEPAVEDFEQEPKAEAQEEPEPQEPEDPEEPEELDEPEELEEQKPESRGPGEQESADDEEPVQGVSAGDAKNAVTRAREQLGELLERNVESVSSLERTQDGWRVALEVLELSRIPDSTDVLASYEMELDDDLNLRRYHQARRYHRAQANSGEGA
jgi:hypothetical protein